MKFEDLKIGELYYTATIGTLMITNLYSIPEDTNSYNGEKIGTCVRLMGSREYPLYSKRVYSEYFRLASSEDIEEDLLASITNFNVGNYSLSISESNIYLTGDDSQVSLKPSEVRELMKILEKEVNK